MIARYVACACFVCAAAFAAEDAESSPPPPGIPAYTQFLNHGSMDRTKINNYVAEVLALNEKHVLADFELKKKGILDELAKREEERREAERRRTRFGTGQQAANAAEGPKTVRVNLEFVTPELQLLKDAASACRTRREIAREMVRGLPALDKDNNGVLDLAEYVSVASLAHATARLLRGLDENNDGRIVDLEIERTKGIPETVDLASRRDQTRVSKPDYRIPAFDADGDGVLSVGERKTLSVAFANAAIQYEREERGYLRVAERLEELRGEYVKKYESLEVGRE